MAEYQLYGFGESGNAFKAAQMLSACGLDWTLVPVDFFNGETRSDAYRTTVNEMGEVPVLVHGDQKLAQSGAILTYLANQTGQFNGRDETEKLAVLSWILFDNHKFSSYLATLRFLVAISKSGEPDVIAFLRLRAVTALGIVEKHLAHQPFMVGERVTIADFSLSGYLYHPEDYGIAWSHYPNIARWLGQIKLLPGWKAPYEMMARAVPRRG